MPLLDLPLATATARPPADVRRFLREASRRVCRVQRTDQVPAFAASDFGLPVELVRGSFIPAGAEAGLTRGHDFAWLSRGGPRPAYEAMGLGVEDLDLVLADPWPDEEALIEGLFEGHARPGRCSLPTPPAPPPAAPDRRESGRCRGLTCPHRAKIRRGPDSFGPPAPEKGRF
jgi:hypothetical protein